MTFAELLEAYLDERRIALHGQPRDWNWTYLSDMDPIKRGDVFVVYHGFRDFDEALDAARRGLSGKDRVGRVYSYEGDNNPRGLFVTLSRAKAEEFSSAHGVAVVAEFTARAGELAAPVWPGGGYTVQGQMAQYFGFSSGSKDAWRKRLSAARKDRERAQSSKMPSVSRSELPRLAMSLLQNGEFQALFVGNLRPNRIKRLWVREPREDGNQYVNDPFVPMDRTDFLKRYRSKKDSSARRYPERSTDRRVFGPEDRFDPDEFKRRVAVEFKSSESEVEKILAEFPDLDLVWPKQIPAFLRWIKGLRGKNRGSGS